MTDSARSDATGAQRATGNRASHSQGGRDLRTLALGDAITNPFHEMARAPLLIPMVILAAMAAILASHGASHVARWRKMLFSFLAHHAKPPTVFFQLPPSRVVELGLQIEL